MNVDMFYRLVSQVVYRPQCDCVQTINQIVVIYFYIKITRVVDTTLICRGDG